jgi:hypothetical protein
MRRWLCKFRYLQACGYQVPPSDETLCFSYMFITWNRIRSATTNIFRSFDMRNERIYLFFGSITIQSHINSGPDFITVSSMTYSLIFLFLKYFNGLYFCSHQFQIDTRWLISIIFKKDNDLDVFLKDNPRKYKYNP